MGELDASVFHRYAEYLWRRAGGIVVRWTIGGAILGAVLGAVMLSSWANWPVSHRQAYLVVVLGAVSGAFLGRSLGSSRALGLRLQAQLAQHQLEFERSTLARVAREQEEAAAGEPEQAPAAVQPYVPAGAPPVSAVAPPPVSVVVEPEPEPAPAAPVALEGYGWAAIDPGATT